MVSEESRRIQEVGSETTGWPRWGPYVSERAWGTVREDYSEDGNAWNFLTHDQARSKAYRWGDDAIAGICDRYQILLFAPAFWNGVDPILKERLFGLSGPEGNHGEDVKEYYYHLDSTPTHSYMRYLYKYPQREFPYLKLVEENGRRSTLEPEYELIDTGIFDENRYFDIVIEYAKFGPEDLGIRIEAINRGPEPARLDLLPQLWFRNTWSWSGEPETPPLIRVGGKDSQTICLEADDSPLKPIRSIPETYRLGPRYLYAPADGEFLFTENETNAERLHGPESRNPTPYVKDAFHRWLVQGEPCTNPDRQGSKAVLYYHFPRIEPSESVVLRLRLTDTPNQPKPLEEIDALVTDRRAEADAYYHELAPSQATEDERRIQRQALSGLLWSKQSYLFDVELWLEGDNPKAPPPEARAFGRNQHWRHLNSLRVMTVPDKWEYPWFAAWDLAFQCVSFALVDGAFAKQQLWLLLFEQFQHPNGQIPAYEWEFSDLNPPVHAWAVWRVYNMDRIRSGKADREFLERCFHKLMINFTWWINRVDVRGNNIFEGGFLGLDNITVIDRSMPFGDGSRLEQSDATGWMGMFCLVLMRIALELAKEDRVYESLAIKYFQHYIYVAAAMKNMGNRDYQLWDEQDGFFYDVLVFPDGRFQKFRVRSLVGLIPLFAVERLEENWIQPFKEFREGFTWFMKHRSKMARSVVHTVERDGEITHALTILNKQQLLRLTSRIHDPGEFFSDYGIRSLSKYHEAHPFDFDGRVVRYEPAEAIERLKGGNSNWRGPVWFPTGFLLIESLRKLGKAFGERLGCPDPGKQEPLPFHDLASQIANRLISVFTRDASGRRAVFGDNPRFQDDPHWRDLLLFYEYFHGDTGAGLGASHQTGWTSLVASLIDEWRD